VQYPFLSRRRSHRDHPGPRCRTRIFSSCARALVQQVVRYRSTGVIVDVTAMDVHGFVCLAHPARDSRT